MKALANEEVGTLLNRYFVSSFQRVGTFNIRNGQKQGGNVAAYFCAPDGRVLHAIAGPVEARTLVEEANWVVAKAKEAVAQSKGNATEFKHVMRKLHAQRLEEKYGIRVTPVLEDQALQNLRTALAYRDADGRPLAPVLPEPPIENQRGIGTQHPNDARVHRLLAAHATMRIENLYGAIFEGILGEKVTTKPVQIDQPFAWLKQRSR